MIFTVDGDNGMPKILVLGVGGCGCNTSSTIGDAIEDDNLKIININTDASALERCKSGENFLIGRSLTNGFGAGARPEVGLDAAKENEDDLKALFDGQDIIFITAGLGGGTGTGATPFIIELARNSNKPVICIPTLPFKTEGELRMKNALEGLKQIKQLANAVVTLPNDNILETLGESVGVFSAFKHADRMLEDTLRALIDMLTSTGYVNIDLNDFITVMSQTGDAILGTSKADDQSAVELAVKAAVNNPIYQDRDMTLAKGALVQVNVREEITMGTYNKINDTITSMLKPSTLLVSGITEKPDMQHLIEIFVIGTGISDTEESVLEGCQSIKLAVSNETPKDTVSQTEAPVTVKKLETNVKGNTVAATRTEPETRREAMEYLNIPAFLRNSKKN
ncbi:cell division protein FtsZ [Vibrio chaetopteri]|uniref:cell division protein FtsZ n=1 Tax=Vibrio chaetopteri TaxID=3016528 RepID=UPI003AB2DD9D